MNERIKELYKQAGFTVARGWGLKDTVPEDVFIANVCVSNEMKKFAELIVQEMCSVLDKAQWDKGEDWICADGTRIIPQIKEHFGVEE
jgi:hypothetical protein